MDWKKFFVMYLRNVLLAMLLGGVLLGGCGYLLAGKEGASNLAVWGLLLGLMGGVSGGMFMLINGQYWSDFAGRYARGWLKKETEGEEKPAGEDEEDHPWPR